MLVGVHKGQVVNGNSSLWPVLLQPLLTPNLRPRRMVGNSGKEPQLCAAGDALGTAIYFGFGCCHCDKPHRMMLVLSKAPGELLFKNHPGCGAALAVLHGGVWLPPAHPEPLWLSVGCPRRGLCHPWCHPWCHTSPRDSSGVGAGTEARSCTPEGQLWLNFG